MTRRPVAKETADDMAMIEHADGNLVVVYAHKDGLVVTWRDQSKKDLPWSEPVVFAPGAGRVRGLSLVQERATKDRPGNLVVTATVPDGRVLLWWRDSADPDLSWHGPDPVATGAA